MSVTDLTANQVVSYKLQIVCQANLIVIQGTDGDIEIILFRAKKKDTAQIVLQIKAPKSYNYRQERIANKKKRLMDYEKINARMRRHNQTLQNSRSR